jgi:hypothetical protein
MQIKIQNNNQIYFNGNNKSLRIFAENAVRTVRDEFGYMPSPSVISTKIRNYSESPFYRFVITNLERIWAKYQSSMVEMRYNVVSTIDPELKYLKQHFKKYKAINCTEYAYLLKHELSKKGIKADIIELKIIPINPKAKSRKFNNHVFVVFNLAPNAKLKRIKSWGSQAIVADAWNGGTVAGADNALKKYLQVLKFDPEKEIAYIDTGIDKMTYAEIFRKPLELE